MKSKTRHYFCTGFQKDSRMSKPKNFLIGVVSPLSRMDDFDKILYGFVSGMRHCYNEQGAPLSDTDAIRVFLTAHNLWDEMDENWCSQCLSRMRLALRVDTRMKGKFKE